MIHCKLESSWRGRSGLDVLGLDTRTKGKEAVDISGIFVIAQTLSSFATKEFRSVSKQQEFLASEVASRLETNQTTRLASMNKWSS